MVMKSTLLPISFIKECLKMGKRKVKVAWTWMTMDLSMLVNLRMAYLKGKVLTLGEKRKFMKVNGKITWCMVKALWTGRGVASTMVSSCRTREQALEHLSGVMVPATLDGGPITSNMAWVSWATLTKTSNIHYGKMVKWPSCSVNFNLDNMSCLMHLIFV